MGKAGNLKKCSAKECQSPPVGRGLCNKHYIRKYRSKARKLHYIANRESTLKINEAWRVKNRERWDFLNWRAHLKRKYAATPDDYQALSAIQGHVCLICKEPPQKAGRDKLCFDHDHESGEIRGLLCSRCNTGLGGFRDNTAWLKRAILYLQKKLTKKVYSGILKRIGKGAGK